MVDGIYTDSALAAFYDALNPRGPDTDFYCRSMPSAPSRILDLGCGTGLLSAELAIRGHQVTGVDPAAAMLDIARQRQGGHLVQWIEEDAQTLDLKDRYDIVLMTGHVFQVFLSDEDAFGVLAVARRHLSRGGVLMFESRNPAVCAWRDWTPESSRRLIDHGRFGHVEVWHQLLDGGRTVRFNTHTHFIADDVTLVSESRLAFRDAAEIGQLLLQAGFRDIRWMGDWDGSELKPDSREIVVRAR